MSVFTSARVVLATIVGPCLWFPGCDTANDARDVSASFDVALTGDGDGCAISGWTIATQNARLVLSGTTEDLSVTIERKDAAGELTILAVKSDGTLKGSGDASSFEATGLSDELGPCGERIHVSISAKTSDGTVLGTITYEPADSCAEVAGCAAEQVFSGPE